MNILAIDTSCDDTCVSILKIKNQKLKILSNVVSSQVKLHAKYGGVYPFLAKREHQRNLAPVLKRALIKARLLKSKIKNQKSKIDLIAVTIGPGLEPCLWAGVNFAKELAGQKKLRIIPVNHIEAHILVNFLNTDKYIVSLFPVVCLVVSGGHTQLILMKGFGKYKILGETRDDAAGECLDKAARILGLGYPGGPAIAAEAAKLKVLAPKAIPRRVASDAALKLKVKLPRPMFYSKDYDFSFSGLKTAVLYDFKNRDPKTKKSKQYIQAMAAEIQQAVIDVLIKKTVKAAKDYKAKTIILGGGVIANQELRQQFMSIVLDAKRTPRRDACQLSNVKFLAPAKNFCTDNAAMVAAAGYFQWLRGEKTTWQKIKANANLRIN